MAIEKKHKAYKFRMEPNPEQKILFSKTFGCVRFVYNHFLAQKTILYETKKESLSYTAMAKQLVPFKKEHTFLKEVDSIALQQALRHLDTAFQNFFRDKHVGYPKFKSKKKHRDSYTTVCVNGNIRLEGNKLILPKAKAVKIRAYREIPKHYRLTSVTISRNPSGQYDASLCFEYEEEIISQEIREESALGLDFSMPDLFVSSDETITTDDAFLHRYRKAQKRLAKEQRKLSHCNRGSRRYEKQRCRVAKQHQKAANQRKDYLHKISKEIADQYTLVCIEDLNMKGMAGSLHFGKSVGDNGWGMFVSFLEYKLKERGKKLIKVSKWFASSKQCHVCGKKKEDLTLADRVWTCGNCGTTHDRDKNASINIKREGLRIAFA